MKTLLLLITTLIFISCEGGGSGESISVDENGNVFVGTNTDELEAGKYKSNCSNNSYWRVEIDHDQLRVRKFNTVDGSGCDQIASVIESDFDIVGGNIQHLETTYSYYDAHDNYICGQSHMLGNGSVYNIDNISCAYSMENTGLNFRKTNSGYEMNGIELNKF